MLGYALESFVDVWSSILVLWRFWGDGSSEAAAAMMRREKYASFGISLSVSTSVMEYLATLIGKKAVKHIRAQEAARRLACRPCLRH